MNPGKITLVLPGAVVRMVLRAICPLAIAMLAGCTAGEETTVLDIELEASPAVVDFAPLYSGLPQTKRLLVSNVSAVPVALEVSERDEEGSATFLTSPRRFELVPGEQRVLWVTATPVALGGSAAGRLLLKQQETSRVLLQIPMTAAVGTRPACDDGNPCTEDAFVQADGSCVHTQKADFTPCDDDDLCTTRTICRAGQCHGERVDCGDDFDCTIDTCDPDLGCVNESSHDRCDDEDPCTEDTCSNVTGCESRPREEGAMCSSSGCTSFGVCEQGACRTYPVPDGAPCDDENSCTTGETCHAGVCGAATEVQPEAAPPQVVGLASLSIDHCGGDGASGHCPRVVLGTPKKVLAVHDGASETFIVWQTDMRDPNGEPCSPARPLSLPGNEGESPVDDPENLRDCAATVALTKVVRAQEGDEGVDNRRATPLQSTTLVLRTIRGPAAAAFVQTNPPTEDLPGLTPLALVSANSQTGNLIVEQYTVQGIRRPRTVLDYGGFHTVVGVSNGPLAVSATPSRIVVVAGTADVRACPLCESLSLPASTQQLTVHTLEIGVEESLVAIWHQQLFVDVGEPGDCDTFVGQSWTRPALIAFSDTHYSFSFSAATDGCGGRTQTYLLGFEPTDPPPLVFPPMHDSGERKVRGVSVTMDAFGQHRIVLTTEAIDDSCAALEENGSADEDAGSLRCFTVEEVSDDAFGGQSWSLEGFRQPHALSVVVGGDRGVVTARANDTRLLQPFGGMTSISAFSQEGRRWQSFEQLRAAPALGRSMAGILAPEPSAASGEHRPDGEERREPAENTPAVGLQLLGCER